MTREAIVDLLERRVAVFNDGDVEGFVEAYAADAVVESPLGGTHQGRAAIGAVVKAFFEAFEDATLTTDAMIIDGDNAVHVVSLSGTDTGGFMGMAPSGRPALVPIVNVCRVADGHITHERRVYDFTGLLVQIGVLKAKPA